jgi:hypothetical protein
MLPGTCGIALLIGRRYKSDVNEDIETRPMIDLYAITDYTENKFSENIFSENSATEISMVNAAVSTRADA